jgi:hypothetical protein
MPMSPMDDIFPLFEAIQQYRGQYTTGGSDYSVTTLLAPPRVVHLNKRHHVDQYVEDLIHSFCGTAVHEYVERMLNERFPDGKTFKCEERLRTTVLDRKISGAYDYLYLTKDILYDLKTTSTWKAVFGDKDDWSKQQNMYRHMYKMKYNVDLTSLRIFTIYRDWSLANLYRSSKNYPKQRCMEYRLPLMPYGEVDGYMHERVQLMIDNEKVKDDDLPRCSFEDMWSEPDKVAVKSTRLKRAVRVLSCQKAADNFVIKYLEGDKCKDTVSTLSFEVRPAVRKRCESWCPANSYCNQYHEYLAGLAKKKEDDK